MNHYKKKGRRHFIKKAAAGSIVLTSGLSHMANAAPLSQEISSAEKSYAKNDTIRLAFIGCGIQGFSNAQAASKVKGIEFAAACDLYDGRMQRMKEVYGDHLYTSRDFREILQREDIDAVCISTSDHWHDHISIAALEAGKAVYCEKPMVQHLDEGHAVIAAEKKSGLPFQVGSQPVSSIATMKAKELLEAGVIGRLNVADMVNDRTDAMGAWQYSIPTDASPETVDWDRFLGDAPKRPFDKKRFFRWRNYRDYGTGIAGDLFVHLFSRLHVITNSYGPNRIYSTGGLRFWKDGRDVPDISLGLYDYPETESHPAFNVQMRVNFVDGSGGGSHVRLIGDEGVMTIGWQTIHVQRSKVNTVPMYGGWDSFHTFTAKQQEDYKKWYHAHYPPAKPVMTEPGEMEYTLPDGYDSHVDHWQYFADSIRHGHKLVEDATFGLRAAGPALASNNSYFEQRAINWDPVQMRIL